MTVDSDRLIYLYGMAPAAAPEPPPTLEGVEGGAVRLIRVGDVAAIVGEVPATLYADDLLNARLEDLDWVGERGVAHERVLDWYADRVPVLPLSLFSLHRDDARLRERLEEHGSRYTALLERLSGRREWGVKLWRRPDAVEHIDQLSPSLAQLSREMEAAPAGRKYLLERKREKMRTEELRLASQRLAQRVYGTIAELAERSATSAVPAQQDGSRVLLLNASFLVPNEGFDPFHRRVSQAAHEVNAAGFDLEFTGPWPAYHFADLDGG